ncbi:helix-turn-helix domain-containing protein [Corynebacterium flavescens]|uniref:helix-turn-helix domain-containing protein n=1 Tax=Corynebacterium flavescens TaxID=28028 RepID=UPI003FD2C112
MANRQKYIGPNIIRLREELGWPRTELLKRLEEAGLPLNSTTVRRIEAGTQEPKITEALTLAKVLGVDVEELLQDPNDPERLAVDVNKAGFKYRHAAEIAERAIEDANEQREILAEKIIRAMEGGISSKDLAEAVELAARTQTANDLAQASSLLMERSSEQSISSDAREWLRKQIRKYGEG